MKVQVVINPISGVGSKRKIPQMIQEAFSKRKDVDLAIDFTEYPGHASELTANAIDQGAEVVIAVGGDGTINEVARAMVNTKATLGIIPKGSGNGLARSLHIPMDVKGALDVIEKGLVKAIDCCKANDHIFFCTCGVGFDATVSQKFASSKRRGSLTYIMKTIEEYLRYKPETYQLVIEDQTIEEKAFLIACANASQYGNNAYIAPHADMQDGKLDITILSTFTPLDITPLALQLFAKQIDKNSKIKTLRAANARIVREKPGVIHLDGEPFEMGEVLDISTMPGAINVFTANYTPFAEEVQNFFYEVSRFFDHQINHILR